MVSLSKISGFVVLAVLQFHPTSGRGVLAQLSQPSAIVEDIRTTGTAVLEVFDYLSAGQVLQLGVTDTLVLGYLKSCTRETIIGGRVTVGTLQSTVEGGVVTREVVECNGGHTKMSVAEAGKSGVSVARAGDEGEWGTEANPIRVYSQTPAFTFSNRVKRLFIQRLHQNASGNTFLVSSAVLDLAQLDHALARGGIYEATANGVSRVFKVDAYASPGGALVGRLVQF